MCTHTPHMGHRSQSLLKQGQVLMLLSYLDPLNYVLKIVPLVQWMCVSLHGNHWYVHARPEVHVSMYVTQVVKGVTHSVVGLHTTEYLLTVYTMYREIQ